MLKTVGASGLGVFPAASLANDERVAHHGVERVGNCAGVEMQFYAISADRKVGHPLVQRLLKHCS